LSRRNRSSYRRPILIIITSCLLAGCAPSTGLNFDVGETSTINDDAVSTNTASPMINQSAADLATPVTADVTAEPDDENTDGFHDEVRSALGSLLLRWEQCFHRPAKCDPVPLTAPTSPERERLAEAVSYYSTEQIRTRPGDGRLEWSVESMIVTGDRARVTTCEYDTRIFFDASMSHTELGDIIFDTTVWTRRVEWTLARVDDSWRLWSRRVDRRSPVERFCQP